MNIKNTLVRRKQQLVETLMHLTMSISAPSYIYERFVNALAERYHEPHRKYHGVRHLLECLQAHDKFSAAHKMNNSLIEIALWYHDAIYHPELPENEENSAKLAEMELRQLNLKKSDIATVCRLVKATKHIRGSKTKEDECYIQDIDLGIFAYPWIMSYEEQIREEYSFVPEDVYLKERVRVLKEFEARDPIYVSLHIRRMWEEKAKKNLSRLIRDLEKANVAQLVERRIRNA